MKKFILGIAFLTGLPMALHAASNSVNVCPGCTAGIDVVTLSNSTPVFTAIAFVDGTTQTTKGLGSGSNSYIQNSTAPTQSAVMNIGSATVMGPLLVYAVGGTSTSQTPGNVFYGIKSFVQGSVDLTTNSPVLYGSLSQADSTATIVNAGAENVGSVGIAGDRQGGQIQVTGVHGITFGQGLAPLYNALIGEAGWKSNLVTGTTSPITGGIVFEYVTQLDGVTPRSTGTVFDFGFQGPTIGQGAPGQTYSLIDISSYPSSFKGQFLIDPTIPYTWLQTRRPTSAIDVNNGSITIRGTNAGLSVGNGATANQVFPSSGGIGIQSGNSSIYLWDQGQTYPLQLALNSLGQARWVMQNNQGMSLSSSPVNVLTASSLFDITNGSITVRGANAGINVFGTGGTVQFAVNTNGVTNVSSMNVVGSITSTGTVISSSLTVQATAGNFNNMVQVTTGSFDAFSVGGSSVVFGVPPVFQSVGTGAGVSGLGTNCPAATPSTVFTWLLMYLPDGSRGYIPIWK